MVVIKGSELNSALPDTDICGFTFENVKHYLEQEALVDASTGRTLKYSEYINQIARVTSGLQSLGVSKGTVVSIICSHIVEIPVALLAALKIGAIVVSNIPSTPNDILTERIKETQTEWVITEVKFVDKLQDVIKANSIKGVITIGSGGDKPYKNCETFESLLENPPCDDLNPNRIQPEADLGLIAFTGGTTGKPKGVLHTHKNVVAARFCMEKSAEVSEYKTDLCTFPLAHIASITNYIIGAARAGKRLVFLSNFTMDGYLNAVEKYKPGELKMGLPMVNVILNSNFTEQRKLASVKEIMIGGTVLDMSTVERLQKVYDVRVGQAYRCSEMCTFVTSPTCHPTPLSAGHPIMATQFKIVGVKTGIELDKNEAGEVWVKTPFTMKGYLNNAELTKEVITEDGWYKTGDYGYFDEEGKLLLKSRIKHMITYDEHIIVPHELEQALLSHPSVVDAAAVGLQDKRHGQVPEAFVELIPGSTLSAHQLLQYANEKLADYKRFANVKVIEKMPRTPTGTKMYHTLQAVY